MCLRWSVPHRELGDRDLPGYRQTLRIPVRAATRVAGIPAILHARPQRGSPARTCGGLPLSEILLHAGGDGAVPRLTVQIHGDRVVGEHVEGDAPDAQRSHTRLQLN